MTDIDDPTVARACAGTCGKVCLWHEFYKHGYCVECWRVVAPTRGAATFIPSTPEDKVRALELVAQGYKQISRKYRTLGRLPEGMTGLEALATADPDLAKRMLDGVNERAGEQFMRCFARGKELTVTLTQGEFAEYLRATGRNAEQR